MQRVRLDCVWSSSCARACRVVRIFAVNYVALVLLTVLLAQESSHRLESLLIVICENLGMGVRVFKSPATGH